MKVMMSFTRDWTELSEMDMLKYSRQNVEFQDLQVSSLL